MKGKEKIRRDFFKTHMLAEGVMRNTDLLLAMGKTLSEEQLLLRRVAEDFLKNFPKECFKDGKVNTPKPQTKVVIYN